ncbi:MAG: dephospho-CoA kinase [Aestuariivirga sp.]
MISVGLTGSIATGKSEVAKLFFIKGIPVFDSDAVVHDLCAEPATRNLIGTVFPEAIINGKIDRFLLARQVFGFPEELKKLEDLVHPLVRRKRNEFITHWQGQNCRYVILDIPLLFETGADREVDYTIVVSADEGIQKARAMARPGMTEEKLAHILKRQIPDMEKRARADFVIENSSSMEHLRIQVDALSRKLAELAGNKKP